MHEWITSLLAPTIIMSYCTDLEGGGIWGKGYLGEGKGVGSEGTEKTGDWGLKTWE